MTRGQRPSPSVRPSRRGLGRWIHVGWVVALLLAAAVRVWNALTGPLLLGYDDHGHVGYILFLDLYGALPWADQGWSYFHPPLHYLLGWALAQSGDADVLLRGLALWGGAASLGIAAASAAVVRLVLPGRAGLPLLAFVAVAFLPVYLYTSQMAGNELSAALLGTLGFALFLSNEARERPTLRRDAGTGALLGLALLTKFSAGIALAAVAASLLLRGLRAGADAAAWRRVALRGLVLGGVAVLLAAPWYARNLREFGTPFRMSRQTEHVAQLERSQPPGSRTWRDFTSVSPALLKEPDPRAAHQLHSVWGSAYAQMWADLRLVWELLPEPQQPRIRAAARAMVALGLAPSLLALAGAALLLADALRGRRSAVSGPILVLAALSLGSFAAFNVAAPHHSATKASYLLGMTLPYAVFLARATARIPRAGGLLVALPAAAAALVATHGLLLPPLESDRALGALYVHLGQMERGRAFFEASRQRAAGPPPVPTDNLGDVALLEGRPSRALDLYRVHRPAGGEEPFRRNAMGVAAALAGHRLRAEVELSVAIEAGAGEVGLANRGAARTAHGRLKGAESDLRAALRRDPALAPAWQALAQLLEQTGRSGEAAAARAAAAAAASAPPRGHPYGIPGAFGQARNAKLGMRWLLWLDEDGLRLARAPFRPADALPVREARPRPPAHPHVVLIVVDTLRADHLGVYGYPRPTSPRIDALARAGIVFTRARAPSSWTLPSVASLFTSRTPIEHRVSIWGRSIATQATTLGERFSDAGYRTLGVSGNFVHVSESGGFARGFDSWTTLSFEADEDGEALLRPKGVGMRAPTAAELNAAVLERLPPPDGPSLFLYAHYMDPHSDYDPPERFRSAFARDAAAHAAGRPATSSYLTSLVREGTQVDAGERRRLVDLYDAEIARVDEAIGALVDELVRRGFGEDLVVAIVSDHGEELGDHGSWFHGMTLHGELLAVPIVIHDMRRAGPGERRDEPVDLLDVPTTLLALAGIEPAAGMHGRALLEARPAAHRVLLSALEPNPVFEDSVAPRRHRRALLDWPWKVIVDLHGEAAAYHLERDPGERAPRPASDPELPAALRAAADGLGAQIAREQRGEPSPISEEARRRLRALGYAQ